MTNETRKEIVLYTARLAQNMLVEASNNHAGILSREQRHELLEAIRSIANLSDLVRGAK